MIWLAVLFAFLSGGCFTASFLTWTEWLFQVGSLTGGAAVASVAMDRDFWWSDPQPETILPPNGRSTLRSPSDYERASQTLNWPS